MLDIAPFFPREKRALACRGACVELLGCTARNLSWTILQQHSDMAQLSQVVTKRHFFSYPSVCFCMSNGRELSHSTIDVHALTKSAGPLRDLSIHNLELQHNLSPSLQLLISSSQKVETLSPYSKPIRLYIAEAINSFFFLKYGFRVSTLLTENKKYRTSSLCHSKFVFQTERCPYFT